MIQIFWVKHQQITDICVEINRPTDIQTGKFLLFFFLFAVYYNKHFKLSLKYVL